MFSYTADLIFVYLMFISGFFLLLLVIMLIKNTLRDYFRSQRLKFTQAEVKDRRKEIENLQSEISDNHMDPSVIKSIFYNYNDLIIGIYEGLFDEHYVKMTIGYEILMFYQKYGTTIASYVNKESESLALEMMLKKWDREGFMLNTGKNNLWRMV